MQNELCPWMDSISQRAKDGGAICPWMDGISIPGGRIPQRAMDGDAVRIKNLLFTVFLRGAYIFRG